MTSPIDSIKGVMATFSIKINGADIPSDISILSVDIWKCAGEYDLVSFTLLDGSPDTGTFDISSSPLFVPGNKITIAAGYYNQNQLLFDGLITTQNIIINEFIGSGLKVGCQSTSIATKSTDTAPVISLMYGQSIKELNTTLAMVNNQPSISGNMKFQGTAIVQPSSYVSLDGLGTRFNGNHYILAVQHNIAEGNWHTEISIGMPTATAKANSSNRKLASLTTDNYSIVLDDEKQQLSIVDSLNNNSIIMNSNGITIKSARNINIQADQQISIQGTQGIKVQSSGGDVAVNAMNIKETANMQFIAQGSQTASINAGMQLTLKAAMIMIN